MAATDDKYNGLYIDQALVKGKYYGLSSGPKSQVFTGNINNDPESLRNKALLIISPSSANGTFPTSVIGHKSTVLTTRYGDNSNPVYLQKLFDASANIEYERVYLGSWRAWQRITTEGDASSTATAADQRSRDNANSISTINTAIGGMNANPSINSRVNSNTSAINQLRNDCTSTDNDFRNRIGTLEGRVGYAKNSELNQKITIYQGSHVIDIPSGDASLFPIWNDSAANLNWANAHGCGYNSNLELNSVMTVVNANAGGGSGHEIHIESMQYRPDVGWILTYNSSTRTSAAGVYGLNVSWLLFVTGGSW